MNFDLEHVQSRVARMSDGMLLQWLEVAIPGMQRHLEMYQRTQDLDHLGELAMAEMSANLVVTELMERRFGPPEVVDSAPSEQEKDTATTSARRRFRKRRAGKTGTVPVT